MGVCCTHTRGIPMSPGKRLASVNSLSHSVASSLRLQPPAPRAATPREVKGTGKKPEVHGGSPCSPWFTQEKSDKEVGLEKPLLGTKPKRNGDGH